MNEEEGSEDSPKDPRYELRVNILTSYTTFNGAVSDVFLNVH